MRQLAELALRSGDEVVLPSFGGERAARAVQQAGAVPVFADIDGRSLCLDTAAVEAVLTPRSVAVVAVHLFGHPADMVRLEELCHRRDVRLVEWERTLGGMPSAAAEARRRNAAFLTSRLRGVLPPYVRPGAEHAFEEYVVRVPGNGRPDRDAFGHALRARGVECHVPIATPAHRLPDFRSSRWLPESESAADQCLSLPIRESMTRRELQRVASACNSLGGLLCEPAC